MQLNSYIKVLTILAILLASLICIPVSANIQSDFQKLEKTSGGHIGVFSINTANKEIIQYRANERFPFCSTFKVLGVGAVLKRSMTDKNLLTDKITYQKDDLLFWSPITAKHVATGMSVSSLCRATIMYSDNAAINLLITKLGGPQALTSFIRTLGDNTFYLQNSEPNLNSNPTDIRDTSTPAAMATDLQKLALGNILASEQRQQLINWLKDNTTGNGRIRAGVPKGWVVADKTGSGDYGATNDIAVIWPPEHSPIIVAIYYVNKQQHAPKREDILASVTHSILSAFAEKDSRLGV